MRILIIISFFICSIVNVLGQNHYFVVSDSVTRLPLSNASIFDKNGNLIGLSSGKGITPMISQKQLPITIRFIGYKERHINDLLKDTIYLDENYFELPEIEVVSKNSHILHILGYVREYSTLSTYNDSIILFREKMVDFMIPLEDKLKFKGWNKPRILKSKSYYRFTNSSGLDSVSDECEHHFSWSDWIGVLPKTAIPNELIKDEIATDTIFGKYSPTEIWQKNNGLISIDINVMADTLSRKWVPNLSGFFDKNLDFETIRLRLNYDDSGNKNLTPMDLRGYSFNIESTGRGRKMFRFNHLDEKFFVSSYAEFYILDKEIITLKEARKWEKQKFDSEDIEIFQALEAPELQPEVVSLINRVNQIDKDKIILSNKPDLSLISHNRNNRNFDVGTRFLNILKNLTGITSIKYHRNNKKNWKKFQNQLNEMNKNRIQEQTF